MGITGTSSFDNPQALNPIYFPSDEDLISGGSSLSLNIIDVDGIPATDTMQLVFTNLPGKSNIPSVPEQVDILTISQSEYNTEIIEGAEEYNWSIFPESAGSITGTGTMGLVTWNTNYEGDVWISVTGSNNCGSGNISDSLLAIVTKNVGIINNETSDFSITPNPSTGFVTISTSSEINDKFSITIINTHGKKIISLPNVELDDNSYTSIDLRSVPSGMYFVILSNNSDRNIE
jgi:type IX secretion system substrate protein